MDNRMLIIDDEPSIVFSMSEYFTTRGFEVDCAQDKSAANAFLAQKEYAVISADLRLSGRDEEEGLEIIAGAHQQHPLTRKILLTAYGSPRAEMEAFKRGADAFLHKPRALSEVFQIVTELLEIES